MSEPSTAPLISGSESRVRVDEAGTVHMPALAVPLSSYMSAQAQKAFIKAAKAAQSSDIDWRKLPLETVRARDDLELQKFVDRARVLHPVMIEDRVIGGVHAKVITPESGVSPAHRRCVLVNFHGGAFFSGAGSEALVESIPVASLGQFKVITVDYRQGPENQFPAASEDAASVYAELLKHYEPHNIGIYGCSAGGILSAMAVAWFQQHHLPAPGALGIFSAGAFGSFAGPPSTPGTWGGDSRYTTPPLIGEQPLTIDPKDGPALPDYATAYLGTADLTDPLISPALSPSVLKGFPTTLLITGTRAYDMSAAVQTHRALTRVGVSADLHVWDGMGHCFFFDPDLPESQEAYAVIAKFFSTRLGR